MSDQHHKRTPSTHSLTWPSVPPPSFPLSCSELLRAAAGSGGGAGGSSGAGGAGAGGAGDAHRQQQSEAPVFRFIN